METWFRKFTGAAYHPSIGVVARTQDNQAPVEVEIEGKWVEEEIKVVEGRKLVGLVSM